MPLSSYFSRFDAISGDKFMRLSDNILVDSAGTDFVWLTEVCVR